MARIVLGVTGGIAAYKAILVLRQLTTAGHTARVVPTPAALTMVGAPTFEALSGAPVHASVFDDVAHSEHVSLGQSADLIVVVPATADFIARARAGMANDLLSATLLVARCPIVMAPAMHTEMWNHPATVENLAVLRDRGIHIVDPAVGPLAGGDVGAGRLAEIEDIMAAVNEQLGVQRSDAAIDGENTSEPGRPLAGLRVLVSAGGTREPIDPVRFIGNRSSGRQGAAIARAAQAQGAEVTVVAANVSAEILEGLVSVPVSTASELQESMETRAAEADIIVMAAAVADYRPAAFADHKLKKGQEELTAIELVRNPDILAGLVSRRAPGQIIVGFAAETGDAGTGAIDHAREKARRKGADFLVFNQVGENLGFGDVPNTITILDSAGRDIGTSSGSKDEVAIFLLEVIKTHLPSTS